MDWLSASFFSPTYHSHQSDLNIFLAVRGGRSIVVSSAHARIPQAESQLSWDILVSKLRIGFPSTEANTNSQAMLHFLTHHQSSWFVTQTSCLSGHYYLQLVGPSYSIRSSTSWAILNGSSWWASIHAVVDVACHTERSSGVVSFSLPLWDSLSYHSSMDCWATLPVPQAHTVLIYSASTRVP